jgi:hypothetical protein
LLRGAYGGLGFNEQTRAGLTDQSRFGSRAAAAGSGESCGSGGFDEDDDGSARGLRSSLSRPDETCGSNNNNTHLRQRDHHLGPAAAGRRATGTPLCHAPVRRRRARRPRHRGGGSHRGHRSPDRERAARAER